MVESRQIRTSRERALAMEEALHQRGLLGRVVLMETKMVEPKIEEFMVRISSLAPLPADEAVRLRDELLQKAGDLLGEGPDSRKVFLRPFGNDPEKRTKKPRVELSL